MKRNNEKYRLKCGKGKFTALPRVFLESQSLARLSSHALKLFFDLMAQYRGFNNGDLSAAWKVMAARCWKSRDTLAKSLKELQERGFVVMTRQGGLHKCSLFALTLYEIDDCRDLKGRSKYDAHMKPTQTPPGGWFNESSPPSLRLIKPREEPPVHGSYIGTRQAG